MKELIHTPPQTTRCRLETPSTPLSSSKTDSRDFCTAAKLLLS